MKILVLGSEGFIGSHLCNYFLQKKYTVYGADILEQPPVINYTYIKVSRLSLQLEDFLLNQKIDVLINAAGSGNVSYSVSNPLIDFEANTLDVIKILDSIKKYQPACKYIHISSAAVYGNPTELPINETATLSPISPYGYHKQISEIICKEYHHLFKIEIAIVRPFSIFGNGLRKQLLWDICTKLTKTDNEILLFGTGNESRDFIHISDFVLLIDKVLLNHSFDASPINAASGRETTIKEIALIFEKITNKNILFNNKVKAGDPTNWLANTDVSKSIGFSVSANLETSIIDYYNWFCKQIKND